MNSLSIRARRAASARSIFSTRNGRSPLRPWAVAANVLLFLGAVAGALFGGALDGESSVTVQQRMEAGLHERFWQLKVRGWTDAEILILGDSRACQDVSPRQLVEGLPGREWNALNLAFNAGGLTPLIFEHADGRLRRDGRQAIVILGISPQSLTSYNAENSHFRTLANEGKLKSWAYISAPRLMGLLSRRPLPELVEFHPGKQVYHENGWLEAIGPYDLPPERYLDHFENFFESYKVRSPTVKNLMNQTQEWTREGVRVFAFRPPASAAMRAIEDRRSDFDEAAIKAAFEARGGRWIDLDPSKFSCYDNSHLPSEEALAFSLELGRKIAEFVSDES